MLKNDKQTSTWACVVFRTHSGGQPHRKTDTFSFDCSNSSSSSSSRACALSLFSSSTNCYMGSTSKISNNRCCVNSKLPLAAHRCGVRPTRHSALAAAATTLTLTIQLQNDFMFPIINDYGKSPLGMHGQASGGASGGRGAAAAPQ